MSARTIEPHGGGTKCVEITRHQQAYYVALRAKAPLDKLS
jgi:hypothetical protein